MIAPRTLARTAGALYLVVVVAAIFPHFYVRARIVESGDAAATADNLRASAGLFRLGVASDLVANTFFLFTAMALYLLLKHVHQPVAAAMVVFVAVSVAIGCATLLNQYTALTIATGENVLDEAGSDALAMLFLQMPGGLFAGMFFGLWLLPLGYLVIRSGYFPKTLGVLLIVGCAGWLTNIFTHLLVPDPAGGIDVITTSVASIAELTFVAWLLVKGVRVATPQSRQPAEVATG